MASGKLNKDEFGHAMNSIAYGETMMAAVRDYKKELKAQEAAERAAAKESGVHIEQLFDDPELQKLHEERLHKIAAEQEKRVRMSNAGHGAHSEITEGDFLEIVTKTPLVVCHFFHADFESCKIVDKHLAVLAKKYFDTRFIKLSAPDAPFFSVKLNVKMLPCIIMFKSGVAADRIAGLEQLGGKLDFTTQALENALLAAGVVKPIVKDEEDDSEYLEHRNKLIRAGFRNRVELDSDDESSDFDD